MCTLSVVLGQHPQFSLLVAANRDEQLDRPSTGPQVWSGAVPFVAGRDERAGGTWLGVNARGVMVGLTNHWTGRPPDAAKRSRGDVVVELLRAGDLSAVRRTIAGRDPTATNPLLLLAASREGEAFWCGSDEGLVQHEIEPGIFALGNRPPGEDGDAKPMVAQLALVRSLGVPPDDEEDLRERLATALATHVGDRGPAESPCVHTERGFGTVSSTILALSADGDRDRLWHAPAAPCRTPFDSHHELLRSLFEPPRSRSN